MNHKNNYHKNSNKSMGKNKTMLLGHVPNVLSNKNDLVSFKFLFVNSFGVSIAQIWNSRITKL